MSSKRQVPLASPPSGIAAMLFLVCLAQPSLAQLPGTLFGQVTDENGNPVANAEIVLTDPESEGFRQSETTDEKGNYRLFIANAVKAYDLRILRDGFQTLTLNGVKVSARQRTRRNFTITSAAAAAAAPGATAAASSAGGGAAVDLFNRAVAAVNTDDLDSAESLLLEALQEDAELHQANAALARIYLQQEQHEKAVEQALVARTAEVQVDAMNQVLYAGYEALGEKEKAAEVLALMEEANPEVAIQNLFNQAADLYNNGDTAGAKPLLEQVLSIEAEHPRANYLLGMIFVGESDNENARRHLEKFIEVAPDDPEVALAREMLSYLE